MLILKHHRILFLFYCYNQHVDKGLSTWVMSHIVHLHGLMTECLGHVSNCSSAWSHDSVPVSCLKLFICMVSWLSAWVMSQIVHLHGLMTQCLGHVSYCSSAWPHDWVPVSCLKLFICMASYDSVPGSCLKLFICMASYDSFPLQNINALMNFMLKCGVPNSTVMGALYIVQVYSVY